LSEHRCFCAFPMDKERFYLKNISKIDPSDCDNFTSEFKTGIEDYSKAFLLEDFNLENNVEVIAVTDMICNALSKKRFEMYQVVVFSGLFTMMSHRLIVEQMVNKICNYCKTHRMDDAEKHVEELLKLSYCLEFWIYFGKSKSNIKNIALILNKGDRQNYLHALGGAMLFIYLHEVGHIELNHHSLSFCLSKDEAESIEHAADEFVINLVKPNLRPTMLVNALLVFEMINDFELFALKSRNGHPLVYRRIENLKNLVEKNCNDDLLSVVGQQISKSRLRHQNSRFCNEINGNSSLDETKRKDDFEEQLPPVEDCEKGFNILCNLYMKM